MYVCEPGFRQSATVPTFADAILKSLRRKGQGHHSSQGFDYVGEGLQYTTDGCLDPNIRNC